MSRLPVFAILSLGAASSACRYDLDKIYEHEPAQLVALFRDKPFSTVDDDCVACVARRCTEENAACRGDPDCLAFTRCIAESTDPVTQYECRARHVEWLSEEVEERDVSGPFGQCVFQDACSEQCNARDNFQCVEQFGWPTTGERSVPLRLRFIEALSLEEVTDMQVKVCRPDDLYCMSPTSTAHTDEHGEVQLDLAVSLRSFQGYLELSKDDLYPTLLHFGWPITQPGVTNVTVISRMSVNFSVALAGVEPDPERGLLQLRAFTCGGVGAQGVSFSSTGLDERSRTWYADQAGIPSFTAESTAALGAGGVVNVLEGRQTVHATRAEDGKLVAETSVPVRKGYMTVVVMAPLAAQN